MLNKVASSINAAGRKALFLFLSFSLPLRHENVCMMPKFGGKEGQEAVDKRERQNRQSKAADASPIGEKGKLRKKQSKNLEAPSSPSPLGPLEAAIEDREVHFCMLISSAQSRISILSC